MKYKILIFLIGLAVQVSFAQKITIYGIGDSTMADKVNPNQNPEHGWLQVFPAFVTADVKVINKAVNGRSTRSFINENRWDSITKVLKRGDYVFIQFGHNDAKDQDPARYTNPHAAYRHNLMKFVNETRQKGAIPILFSSITRRNFNDKGVLISTHGEYTLEARLVAQELKVPFIDLEYYTEQLEMGYGPEKSKELHLHFKPGEVAYYPDGKDDDTHLSKKGATEISEIVVRELKNLNLGLNKYLKK
jgi:lysophospholipase L1-like esterase